MSDSPSLPSPLLPAPVVPTSAIPRLPPTPPNAPQAPPPPALPPNEAAGRTLTSYQQFASTQAVSTNGWPVGVSMVGGWSRLGCLLLESLLMIVTLGIGWVIWAATLVGHGQTPAKRLLKYRVISSESLRPVGFGRMFFMRYLIGGFFAQILITLTLGILIFMPFWNSKRQNIWDKLSSTYVVSDPADAWAARNYR